MSSANRSAFPPLTARSISLRMPLVPRALDPNRITCSAPDCRAKVLISRCILGETVPVIFPDSFPGYLSVLYQSPFTSRNPAILLSLSAAPLAPAFRTSPKQRKGLRFSGKPQAFRLFYSNSMVPGGLEVISYSTRFTWGTSFTIRFATLSSTSKGMRAQSAVMPSMDVTARMATA